MTPRTSAFATYPQQFRHEEAGYSLTEIMIVVVIIGILALLAVPRFMSVVTRAKMTEAKTMLRHLHTLQESHYYQYDRYGATVAAIGFEQEPMITEEGTARYRIAIEDASPAGYVAVARSVVDFDKDGTMNEWVVTETGKITERVPD